MSRRDIRWIAGIWIALLILAATAAAFFRDDDPATNDALGAGIGAAVFGVLATGLYVYVRRQSWDRRDRRWMIAIGVAGLALAFPLAAWTGDSAGAGQMAGVLIAAAAGLYWSVRKWSRDRRRHAVTLRACPGCRGGMPAEAKRCLSCGARSEPWTLHAGVWWVWSGGTWQWFDKRTGLWRLAGPGAPAAPYAAETAQEIAGGNLGRHGA